MKMIKLLGMLGCTFILGGCMATISPDGTVSASYMLPEVQGVIVESHHYSKPIHIAHRPSSHNKHSSHGRPVIYGPRGQYHPW